MDGMEGDLELIKDSNSCASVFEYCEHRVRIAVPGHELHASVAGGGFTLRAFLSGGLAQL